MRQPATNEQTLYGGRLGALRRMDGLTQADLSESLGVGQSFISQVERGDKSLPDDVAAQAALTFDVPIEYFTVPPQPIESGVLTFRKTSRASARYENMVRQSFLEAARLFDQASRASSYRIADFHDAAEDNVEEAAANLRAALGFSSTDPIPNATRALERLGVGVIHNLMGTGNDAAADHHGMSCPTANIDRPLVATVSDQPGAVSRMTLMHELGHLLYDRHLGAPIRTLRSDEERRAYRFAGAMLIPASVMKRRVTETLTLHAYLAIKADYGISVSALIKRAADLDLISPRRSRSLFIQLNSQGWRQKEPVTVPNEAARLLGQATIYGISPDPRTVSRLAAVRESQVTRWTGLTAPEQPTNVIPFKRKAS